MFEPCFLKMCGIHTAAPTHPLVKREAPGNYDPEQIRPFVNANTMLRIAGYTKPVQQCSDLNTTTGGRGAARRERDGLRCECRGTASRWGRPRLVQAVL